MNSDVKLRKGWFIIGNVQDGDRTLEEQLTGLENINFQDKTVLDLGCAEGLISRYALEHGAMAVHGLEIVPGHIEEARLQCVQWRTNSKFAVCDLDLFPKFAAQVPPMLFPKYDIVLMLSILHKLKKPLGVVEHVLKVAAGLVVVRLPFPVIDDVRSNNRPRDVREYIQKTRKLIEEPIGPRGEWMGVFQ